MAFNNGYACTKHPMGHPTHTAVLVCQLRRAADEQHHEFDESEKWRLFVTMSNCRVLVYEYAQENEDHWGAYYANLCGRPGSHTGYTGPFIETF